MGVEAQPRVDPTMTTLRRPSRESAPGRNLPPRRDARTSLRHVIVNRDPRENVGSIAAPQLRKPS